MAGIVIDTELPTVTNKTCLEYAANNSFLGLYNKAYCDAIDDLVMMIQDNDILVQSELEEVCQIAITLKRYQLREIDQ